MLSRYDIQFSFSSPSLLHRCWPVVFDFLYFLEGSVTVMEEADFTEYGRENFGLSTDMLKVVFKILPK